MNMKKKIVCLHEHSLGFFLEVMVILVNIGKKINVSDWARNMLYYQDGRFAKDRIWCFFCTRFCYKKKNQMSGGFFVDGFFNDGPKTLAELQSEIAGGNTQWLE